VKLCSMRDLTEDETDGAVRNCSCAVQYACEKGTAFPPSIHLLSMISPAAACSLRCLLCLPYPDKKRL